MVIARPADTPQDLEFVRVTRNSCRELMTNYTAEISSKQQVAWWSARNKDEVKLFLYKEEEQGPDIGYGLLVLKDRTWWLTLAVINESWGLGFGTSIYCDLIQSCPGREVWIDVLKTNLGSLGAAIKAGFQMTGQDERVNTLRAYRR